MSKVGFPALICVNEKLKVKYLKAKGIAEKQLSRHPFNICITDNWHQ